MARHAEYCPIAVGVDVLGDRWTPLVIRELMVGAQGFNEIHRGIPRMSRSLLAQRLRQLERLGLVTKESTRRGKAGRYVLTESGQALTPVVWAMGQWAVEWAFGEPEDEECDGLSLLWRMHQHAVPERLPHTRTVVHVLLTGPGAAEGWLDIDRGAVSVCKDDQGLDVQLAVQGETAALQQWLVGLVSFKDLLATGRVRLLGPSRLVRAFPGWFKVDYFAEGLERRPQREGSRLAASA